MSNRLVIVGAGMATAYLLQELGREAAGMDIIVLGEEADTCYNRVLLSNVLAGDTAETELQMLEPGALPASVTFLSGTRAVSVDRINRLVESDCGRLISYDRLVFATGASVARPPLAQTDVCGVEEFRTLTDARKLRSLMREGARAVVVGGGLLGLEAAHGLTTLGFATTVVHRQTCLMNRQLDAEGAAQLQKDLESRGVRFRMDDSVVELETEAETLKGVVLRQGETLPCELLLFATGISPNTDIARDAGLTVDRGIVTDPFMRTSSEKVFALGECSQLGEDCFGLVAPIREQARVLARELLGIATAGFSPAHSPTQLKISGIDIFSAGHLDTSGDQLFLRDANAGIYRRLILRDGRLVGAVLVGDKRGGSWYSELIASGTDISAYRSGLMFGRETSEALQTTAEAA